MSTTGSADRSLPTVVVARQPAEGRERDFERWLRRLTAAADRAPGHLGATIQPPDPQHPDEWVVVYQFAQGADLDAWLESPERLAIMTEGSDLIHGAAREQVLAMAAETDAAPVTAVASFGLRPGTQDQFAVLYDRLVLRMQEFPGFLRCELFEPVEGVQDESVVVFGFASRPLLDDWLRSDARRSVLSDIDDLLEGSRTVNVVGGFGGWFGTAESTPVKRWKQAAVVLLALFPTALVLTLLRRELLPDLALVPSVALSNIVGVAILSWVLMPWLTQALASWLRR